MKIIIIFSFFFFFYLCSSSSSFVTHSVVSYGAKAGEEYDSSVAFLKAWKQACASVYNSEIYVPEGEYLISRPLVFSGKCRSRSIKFSIEGTLVAPTDYHVLGSYKNWLLFKGVDGVFINGGILDARGNGLWNCKNSGGSGSSCPLGATSIEFRDSKNVVVRGTRCKNSQLYHMVILGCRNVMLEGVNITADEDSPNTDGIHVQSSRDVTILSSVVATGDDCVSIGPATSDLLIQGMRCGPGHGISIGSLGKEPGEGGVTNVTVKTSIFHGTKNGVRIKSWARPSSSFVRNVLFEDATMTDVENPIVIDQNYCPDHVGCPQKTSGVKISDVMYKGIKGTSATRIAVKLECSSTSPCTNIQMEDINLTFKKPGEGSEAMVDCVYASGTSSGSILPSGCL